MRTLLILSQLSALALCSCEFNQYEAHSTTAGNSVKETNMQLGGTRSSSRSDGSSYANNYENSFSDGANAALSAAGLYYGAKVNASNNGVTNTQSNNAASITNTTTKADAAVKISAQNAAVETARINK